MVKDVVFFHGIQKQSVINHQKLAQLDELAKNLL